MDFTEINNLIKKKIISNEITYCVCLFNNNFNEFKSSYWSIEFIKNQIKNNKNKYLIILKKHVIFDKNNFNKFKKEIQILKKNNYNINRIKLCSKNIYNNQIIDNFYIEKKFIIENKFKKNNFLELKQIIIDFNRKLTNRLGLSYSIDNDNNRINNHICFITAQFFKNDLKYINYINNFLIAEISLTQKLKINIVDDFIILYDSNKSFDNGWTDYTELENDFIENNDEFEIENDIIFKKKNSKKMIKKKSNNSDTDFGDNISNEN